MRVAGESHALAARRRIRAADFARRTAHRLPSYADDTRAAARSALRPAGADQVPAIETPYGATICALVTRGAGVGIVNPLATVDADPTRIVFRPFMPEIWFRGFTLYPQTPRGNPAVGAFLRTPWISRWQR